MSRAKNLANLIGGASAGTGGLALPSGTTAQRPASAQAGTIRNNTTLGFPEWYSATSNNWEGFSGSKITNIQVTNSSYTVLDDTAVDSAGGYIKITGTGFTSGCSVIIGTTNATAVSLVNSTTLNVQVPALTAGTYTVYVVNTDGGTAIRVNGLNVSGVPAWSTATSLAEQYIDSAISIQLAATSNTTVTYSLQSGSTLPTGLTLSSAGLLSGTVTGLTSDTTYSFVIVATDQENQDTPRTFSVTISILRKISRSLRFNSADSAYLTRTVGSGNRQIFTWSSWIKTGKVYTSTEYFFSARQASTDNFGLAFQNNSVLQVDGAVSSAGFQLTTTQVFRDPSAWYHIVMAVDTTLASGRIKLYINGTQITSFSTETYPAQNSSLSINLSSAIHNISGYNSASNFWNGYMADVNFVDGQALTPSSFGRTDTNTGMWVPKAYVGTYGTNGFYLDFADNSNTTAATLGKDSSANNNHWTPNNFYQRNTSYSTVTGSAGLSGVANLFDGSTSTYCTVTTSGDNFIQFTPTIPISYSSNVRVYCYAPNGYNITNYYSVNNGAEVSFVGGTANFNSSAWITVATGTGTISSLKIRLVRTAPDLSAVSIGAIEVDGVMYTNNTGMDNDSLIDSPSSYGTDTGIGGEVRGNYCTWNPLNATGASTANGNLEATLTGNASLNAQIRGTIAPISGKWYWENIITVDGNQSHWVGVIAASARADIRLDNSNALSQVVYARYDGQKIVNGTQSAYAASYTTGDIIGVALDLDLSVVTFYKNNVSQGTISLPTSGIAYVPVFWYSTVNTSSSGTVAANFGQRPFAYAAPSGFRALCTTNLPNPTIGVASSQQAKNYMDATTFTGSSSSITVPVNVNLTTNALFWAKNHNGAPGWNHHIVADSVRFYDGGSYTMPYWNILATNLQLAESATGNYLSSTTSSSFTGSGGASGWVNGVNYVAWLWQAGNTQASNTNGSITSTVSANTTSGFSIIKWTGAASSPATIGHGLGAVPKFIITKASSEAGQSWRCYHSSLGQNSFITLDTTAAAESNANYWGSTAFTTNVFGVTTSGTGGNNRTGQAMIAYCWAEVPGFSAFGSYTGNSSADGPFVYTGFRPRFILIRQSSGGSLTGAGQSDWLIYDTARSAFNLVTADKALSPNRYDIEGWIPSNSTECLDILSNGFKLRGGPTNLTNYTGANYIYAAFAEQPFKYARAR